MKAAKSKSLTCKGLSKIDMFGEQVNLTFKQNKTYTTKLGAMISIFCLFTMMLFFVVRTKKFITREDPFFSETTLAHDWNRIDLLSRPFMFAVENPDPRVATVSVQLIVWDRDIGIVAYPIEMTACGDLAPGGRYED